MFKFNAKNMRAEMARNNVGVGALAKYLKVSPNTITYKLRGDREFTLSELNSVAELFNCSIDYLAGRKDSAKVEKYAN